MTRPQRRAAAAVSLQLLASLVLLASSTTGGVCSASALPGGSGGSSQQKPPMRSDGSSSSSEPRVEDPPLPVAYLPTLAVKSLATAPPAKPPVAGALSLTPSGCKGAACSGFRISNAPDFSGRTNAATFSPTAGPLQVDPWNPKTYELGSVALTNGGYMVPADAGTALVPVTAELLLATQGTGKSTPLSLPFLVHWSPGSPAPPNTAGLFVLVTRASGSTPAPTRTTTVAVGPGADFNFKVELLGFVSDPAGRGKDASVMGDWGASATALPAGQPGPRVAVKQDAGPQVVRLVARISKVA